MLAFVNLELQTIVRLFPKDDGNFEGRCWTIAVSSLHTARDACVCIESRLGLERGTLNLHMLIDAPEVGRTGMFNAGYLHIVN